MRDFIESWCRKYDAQVYLKELAENKLALKVPGQRTYFYGVEDPSLQRYYVITSKGIAEFYSLVTALESFFKKIKVGKTVQKKRFIRKSSKQLFSQVASKSKVAKKKIAENFEFGDDLWIPDPEALVKKSSRELWKMTSDGKHIARLFDDKNFPLEV